MPLICNYDPVKVALYCVAEGEVSIEDFINLMQQIVSSKEYAPDVRTLWDIRKLDSSSITRKLADQLIELRQNSPQRAQNRIVIIAEENHSFGMSRMYEMLSSGLPQEMMVFRDFDEGEKWLLKED